MQILQEKFNLMQVFHFTAAMLETVPEIQFRVMLSCTVVFI